MRIVITGNTNYISFNGQTIFTINLVEGLAQKGHDVILLIPSETGQPYDEMRHGVRVIGTRALKLEFLHPDGLVAIFPDKQIIKVFREFKPDIVHVHDHYPLSVSVHYYARRFGVKVMGTNHFMPENVAPHLGIISRYGKAFNYVMWHHMLYLFNRLDSATAPSKTAVDIIVKNGLRIPVVAVSNGIDLERFYHNPAIDKSIMRRKYHLNSDKKIFLFVGRVDGEKRLDVIIRALAKLNRDDIQFAITGKGKDMARLVGMVKELNLGDRVVFTGFVPAEDLCPLLNSIDIFTMPSEAELQSIATLEALSCARPVLAARSRALPELVTDDVNGFLFNPGDVADAAQKMARLADHPERWSAYGSASLEKAHFHSLENTIYSYEKVYERTIAGAPMPVITPSTVPVKPGGKYNKPNMRTAT